MSGRFSTGNPSGPTLYRLASERRYDQIPAHVEARPQDVEWADQYGSTALHVICRSQQTGDSLLRAVDAILERAPHLVGQPDRSTWTPLHLACEKRLLWRRDISTEGLVLKLIEACPNAVSVKLQFVFKAKTPFHICCETNASTNVLRAMLRIHPQLATQLYAPKDLYTVSMNPLQLLWDALIKENEDRPDMSKMELLLKSASCGTVEDDPNFRILPASCSIRCPRDYVTRVLSLHANQIAEPDHRGLLPLHYAVQSAEENAQSYTEFLIEWLVNEYPEAASIPFGRHGHVLPLHVLIADRSMTWHKGGVQRLVLASTDVLRIPDPRSRLVPFLESAIHATKSRLYLSTTLELLRAAPEVIRGGFSTATLC